jgi:hypothetical protein
MNPVHVLDRLYSRHEYRCPERAQVGSRDGENTKRQRLTTRQCRARAKPGPKKVRPRSDAATDGDRWGA